MPEEITFPANPVPGQIWPSSGSVRFRFTRGRGWLPYSGPVDPTINELKEKVFAITDGPSVAIDPTNGPIQTWTVATATRTPTEAPAFVSGHSLQLVILPSSGYTVNFTTMGVIWMNGTTPSFTNGSYTIVELWKVGSNIFGAYVGTGTPA